ncbi:hypothetical protein HA402_005055 [Bradysia odoriphaga]|nr:hypothetical protein HA402_005055 [Bradysia odoriphaga]
MKVRTVRQVKQQRPRNRRFTGVTGDTTNVSSKVFNSKLTSPPYRMPPQPGLCGEVPIPGAASDPPLRTHSSKFPIERELVLSIDKGLTKVPLMHEPRGNHGTRITNGIQLLPKQTGAIAPDHPPKQTQAWNTQHLSQIQHDPTQPGSLKGVMTRTPARLPEDVTALADRDSMNKDRENNKNAVSKTYHTLKDLISGKFKKDNSEVADELNNVTTVQHDDYRSPYSALPPHMRQMQSLNQSQPNIYNSKSTPDHQLHLTAQSNQRSFLPSDMSRGVQQRTLSHPQLASFERRDSQIMIPPDRRGSLDNVDVTDSDDGGFASKIIRTPQISYQTPNQKHQSLPGHNQRQSPQIFQHNGLNGMVTQPYMQTPYQHSHMPPASNNSPQLQQKDMILYQQQHQPPQQHHQQHQESDKLSNPDQYSANLINSRQDAQRLSFQKHMQETQQSQLNTQPAPIQSKSTPPPIQAKPNRKTDQPHPFPHPASGGSSDYDKSNSNVDSGRGSAAYSSGRKAQIENSPSPMRGVKNDEDEWVDVVDNELRNILEPGMQNLNIRPASTVSGSVSSMSPPLPPLSPDGSSYKQTKPKDPKQEYGTDSYNRPGRATVPIGPSRAGWPGSSVQKQGHSAVKKNEQAILKRHLFGLDNDLTSTTTRSLDLESLLGGPWGTGQSVSDSETDTQGIRHIRSQLEGLEHMYGEVLKMLGSRGAGNRMHEMPLRGGGRRRHGSLSSLPSSSVSGRPIRDRRRTDDRRKVRDMKGINKRFQRLESHVVTLARSVAHLSSEMRSQHLVTQELERLRDELTTLRSQAVRSQHSIYKSFKNEPDSPNLTNPKRVKKLTKFFGEDPPLMRLFLKKLGYEKYANLFEAERVGMIELPFLGEERLQKLGIPLGPRLRILQEAQISLCKDTTLCIV